jgi:hypothetical protein
MSNLIPFQEMQHMAQAISVSGLFGFKKPEEALALMLIAQAEGRHPAIVARDYHLIQGKPTLKSDAMLARFQEAGGSIEWLTLTDAEVKARFTHAQCGSFELGWTMAQAQSAGLTGSPTWKKFPRAMLRARVISEGIRTALPSVLSGTYTPEEIQDLHYAEPKTTLQAEVVTAPQIEAEPQKPTPSEKQFSQLVELASQGNIERVEKAKVYYSMSNEQLQILDDHLAFAIGDSSAE